MAPKNSEIYSQALVGINDNIDRLANVINEIENAIDQIVLKPIYENNKQHLKTLAQASMVNDAMAAHINMNAKPLVESLREIQDSLSQTQEEMQKVRETMVLLQDRNYPGNPAMKTVVDDNLDKLNTLNNEFGKTFSLMQKSAMVFANQGHLVQPGQREKLDAKLKELHTHVEQLKQQAKQKHTIANEVVEQTVRPKPGKI